MSHLQVETSLQPRIRQPGVLYEWTKRIMDLSGATVLLILFSPIMLAISVLIVILMPGPVLFGHKRVGRHGRLIRVWKFRSMVVNAEKFLSKEPALYERYVRNGYKLSPGEDPRITTLGRFLRKTSLDELPQLFNVLTGSMSLVGPRPVVEPELAEYGNRKAHLTTVKPGITGWWQVSGRSNVLYPERVEVELYYVYNRSLWLDVKILLMTVPAVLRSRGAH